jgi:hypothetical protein
VSEIFPMETRAMAIAFFYAVGTGLGGIVGPLLFGRFIEQGQDMVAFGYYLGAGLMIAAGIVEMALGVEAAGRSLEDVAKPLTAQDAEEEERRGGPDGRPAGGPDGGDGGRTIDLRDRERTLAPAGATGTRPGSRSGGSTVPATPPCSRPRRTPRRTPPAAARSRASWPHWRTVRAAATSCTGWSVRTGGVRVGSRPRCALPPPTARSARSGATATRGPTTTDQGVRRRRVADPRPRASRMQPAMMATSCQTEAPTVDVVVTWVIASTA